MSLEKEKSHQAGRRWNISGSVVAAFEPFLLTLSDDVMTLWDRRDGSATQDMTVTGHVLSVTTALGDIRAGQIKLFCHRGGKGHLFRHDGFFCCSFGIVFFLLNLV